MVRSHDWIPTFSLTSPTNGTISPFIPDFSEASLYVFAILHQQDIHQCLMLMWHDINKVRDSLLQAIMSVLRPYDVHARTVSDQRRGYHQSNALVVEIPSAKDPEE